MDFNTGGRSGRSDDRPLFGGEAGGPAGGPARGPAGGPGGEFDYQDPVGSFIGTVQNVVLNPVGFFRGIAKRGDFVNPLVFALICAVIDGVLGGIVNFFLFFGDPDFGVVGAFASLIGNIILGDPDFGVVGAFASLIGSIILTPILTAIGLFIVAGILHLLVLLLVGPSNAGFEATFRVVSYASITQLVSWLGVIPIIGPLVGLIVSLYGIFLGVVGIREVHATTTGRAALIVLILVAVALFIWFLLVFALVVLVYNLPR